MRAPGRSVAIAARALALALLALCLCATVALADHLRIRAEAEVVSDDGVNLRQKPSTSAEVVAVADATDFVFVLEGPERNAEGVWYQVEYDGAVGWALGDYLAPSRRRELTSRGDDAGRRNADAPRSTANEWTPRVGAEAVVATDGLNLRETPGTSSPLVAVAGQTRFVYVMEGPSTDDAGPWYKVDYDGDVGWVLGTYLGPAAPREAPRRGTAAAPASARASPLAAASSSGPSLGAQVAQRALSLVGSPYAWGGSSPRTGFDCSGLVAYVYAPLGVFPGRTSEAQAGAGRSVTGGELQLGDIVVFANTYAGGYSHTGIYVGNGRFVHAEDYGTGVIVSSVFGGYWGRHYAGARRVL